MADAKQVEQLSQKMWSAAQRIGMRIAEMPVDQREEGFAMAKRVLEDTAREMGVTGKAADELIHIQMEAIRGMVQNIVVGGGPQGGRA
jgi:hypothetical protein